ncbi:MAG: hypothetical protein ABIP94_01160, partial [Planctomycetota bacterium]
YLLAANGLVPNYNPLYSLPIDFLENGGGTAAPGSDGLTLRDAAGNVVDAVVWEYAAWTAAVPAWLEGSGLQGGYLLNLSSPGLHGATMQRWFDGFDTDNNGADFLMMEWTPGFGNGSANTLALPIVENFDATVPPPPALPPVVDTIFASSFVSPTVYAPAAINSSGSNFAIPSSPQGGNVGAVHDSSGGGNSHIARTPISMDYLVETWVYVFGGNSLISASEGESWAIGIGTTDSFGHPIDVAGTYYPGLLCNIGNGPGIEGIAWIAYQRQNQTDFYLVDMNDGGPGFTVLGGPITATPGTNDGWQRLRLRVSGSSVVGNFGGAYGVDNGQRITATVAQRYFGQVYIQYRECILTNASMRPLVIDRLEIYPTVGASVTFTGTGSPTTIAQPTIGTSGGLPQVGNAGFQFNGGGLIPGGISLLAADLGPLLPGIPVPGAPPGLLLYAAPTVVATALNSGAGTATLGLPIPPTNSLIATLIAAQFFDLDLALGVPLPFGSSRGCQVTIGNG